MNNVKHVESVGMNPTFSCYVVGVLRIYGFLNPAVAINYNHCHIEYTPWLLSSAKL